MAVNLYEQHRPREATITVSMFPDVSGDFVCDGTADDVEIQAAIDYVVTAGGGKVLIKEYDSYYLITATITVAPGTSGLEIEGLGFGTRLLLDNGVDASMFQIGANCTRIAFRHMRISGNKDNNAAGHGIDILNTTAGVMIDDLEIDEFEENGINCGAGLSIGSIRITNTRTLDIGDNGIYLTSPHSSSLIHNCSSGNDLAEDGELYMTGAAIRLVGPVDFAISNTLVWGANSGIYITNGDNVKIVNCYPHLNELFGINLSDTDYSVVSNCICYSNGQETATTYTSGIGLSGSSSRNVIHGNLCLNNLGWYGAPYTDNSQYNGILDTNTGADNVISSNICIENRRDGVQIAATGGGDSVLDNGCHDNQRYGINIAAGAVDILVKNNKISGNTTLDFIDDGTGTQLASKPFQFIQGTTFISADGSAKGWEINAEADMAVALGQLPLEVQQVVRLKIWGAALGAPVGGGGQMHLDIVVQAGADDAAYTTENISLANFDSVTTDYVNNDVVHWSMDSGDDADIGDLVGGMSLECKINGGTAADPDGATNATFRVLEIEYV